MSNKPVSPLTHSLIDYVLVGSLLVVPALLRFPKEVKKLYCYEAIGLLGYVACTQQPAAVKPIIPFRTHGKIDPFNVAGFALQTFSKPFRKSRSGMAFNILFTVIAGVTVALTDWDGKTTKA